MTRRHPCTREGCPGTYSDWMRTSGYKHCCSVCAWLDDYRNNLIDALSGSADPQIDAALSDAWIALTEAADRFSEYRRHYEQVWRIKYPSKRRRRRRPEPCSLTE